MEKVEKLPRNTPEWDAECLHFQELFSRWKAARSDRQIQDEIGLSLKKLGLYPEHTDRET